LPIPAPESAILALTADSDAEVGDSLKKWPILTSKSAIFVRLPISASESATT
jgi:hypothetical protein